MKKKNIIPGTTCREKFSLRYRERFLLLALQDNPYVFRDYKEPKILKRLQGLDLVRNAETIETISAQKYTARGALVRTQILKNEDLNAPQ